jgi:hypothetical protein
MDRRFLDWVIRREKGPDADTEALHKLKLGPPYTSTSLITTMCRTRILDTVNFSTCYIKADDTVDTVYLRGRNSKDFSKLDINTYYANRNFFETEQGYFGLGPCWLDRDDLVVLFDGGTTPFILRNVEAGDGEPGDTWQLVGDCFPLGWMHGDYFGHAVVDEMPQETENDAKGPGGQREKYLVKEFFTLI